jgi:hypothetical protein
MENNKEPKKNKKGSHGDGPHVYDVVFEVSKLDTIRLSKGKDNDDYKKQHTKTVDAIVKYNRMTYPGSLSISKSRNIMNLSKTADNKVNLYEYIQNVGE